MNKVDHKKIYDEYKSMSKTELCHEIADLLGGIKSAEIAKLALKDKQVEEKYKYEKEQTDLQHKLNRVLLKEQLSGQSELVKMQIKAQARWMAYSIIGVLLAAVTGAVIGSILNPLISQRLKHTPQSSQVKMTASLPPNKQAISTHYGAYSHQDKKASNSTTNSPSLPPIKK